MKKYRVSVSQVSCADVYVDAESEKEAKAKVLRDGAWGEDVVPDGWCEGHEDTRKVEGVLQVDADGNETG